MRNTHGLPADVKAFQKIKIHVVGPPNNRRCIEVIQQKEVKCDGVAQILKSSQDCQLGSYDKEVFEVAKDARVKNPVFSQLHWDRLLNGVSLKSLCSLASTQEHATNPTFLLLRSLSRSYFNSVIPRLEEIPRLTRLYLLSYKKSEPKSRPFRRPQEQGTVNRDADTISRFLCFLIQSGERPVDSFPIPIHPNTLGQLNNLRLRLEQLPDQLSEDSLETDSDLFKLFHEVMWSIITEPSTEYRSNESMCPLLRFILAAHLLDDSGTFSSAAQITPTLGRVQWCLRATGAIQIWLMREECDDLQQYYEKNVQQFLTIDQSTIFTSLRLHLKQLRDLAFKQPAISRFQWNQGKSTLSIDGQPVSILEFFTSLKDTIKEVKNLIGDIFGDCPSEDILKIINSRTIPTKAGEQRWYTDKIAEAKPGYSMFEEEKNGFKKFRGQLMTAMACNPRFFQTSLTGTL
ncbi:hypothetical protein PQX77_020604, partial [Marasmius sp. AFHP31]